jgi:hypothetical protein
VLVCFCLLGIAFLHVKWRPPPCEMKTTTYMLVKWSNLLLLKWIWLRNKNFFEMLGKEKTIAKKFKMDCCIHWAFSFIIEWRVHASVSFSDRSHWD